jgi:hypothetical protein
LIFAQENVVVVENLRRHAVGATQIAAIRERNAQITHRAGEKIERLAVGGRRGH